MAEQDKFLAMEVLTEKQKQEILDRQKRKKRNYIIGFSGLGVLIIGLGALYGVAVNVWLKDLSSLPYINYEYAAVYDEDEQLNQTATITSFNRNNNIKLPANFRIPAYVNGYKVTAIKADAFTGCNDIVHVEIPDTIETIGDYAFSGCENLKSFTFSKNITKLGVDVFLNTPFENNLADDAITGIGKLLYRVGDSIIKPNSVLVENEESKANLPEKYKNPMYNIIDMSTWGEYEIWGDGIFSGNDNIIYVEIPSTLHALSDSLFKDCNNLESVNLKENITTIADKAFEDCSKLNIDIKDSVTSIGNYAFKGTNISSVTLSDNVTSIGEGAFQDCKQIKTFDWPNHLNEIPKNLFLNCTSLESIEIDDTSYKTIEFLGASAFENTKLKEFKVPMNVAIVEDKAFKNTNLEKITFFRGATYYNHHKEAMLIGVNSIGHEAFLNCPIKTMALCDENGKQLTKDNEMYLPHTLQEVSPTTSYRRTFANNPEMVEITLPMSLGATSEYMFENNVNLETVKFVPVRGAIGYESHFLVVNSGSFYGCEKLKEIELPKSTQKINTKAFMNCSSLTRVALPQNEDFTSLSISVFENCKNLKEVQISEYVTAIHPRAFLGCESLDDIVVGYSGNSLLIGKDAFKDCAKRDAEGNPIDKLNVYLSIDKDKAEGSAYIDKEWHDDTVNVYYKGEWKMENGKPVVLGGAK